MKKILLALAILCGTAQADVAIYRGLSIDQGNDIFTFSINAVTAGVLEVNDTNESGYIAAISPLAYSSDDVELSAGIVGTAITNGEGNYVAQYGTITSITEYELQYGPIVSARYKFSDNVSLQAMYIYKVGTSAGIRVGF